ncbi:MerR family transcriptional regulator/heat shock protein HspR [Arcanobacterium pluranimalium]|uniref:heat shock protein transcriptional repressor HspR n=1 Tax=Arcanobacterium pluranimalium TaxID=108028 RepID=UPI001956B255|nr:MerR family transcriptional regulator [Arcanobacterium pluranimalium]MBM7824266.1 MerR family transcriptional regulator/heat shock protein HspR [Arcanobacterium pluranimalium]
MAKVSRSAPILTVSVAAELAGMHPQTVRQYDRLGLVVAGRTRGGGRRYSLNDVDKLIEIQRLSQDEGINLSGISRILKLQADVERLTEQQIRLEKQLERVRQLGEFMRDELERQNRRERRVFAATASGDVTMAERMDLLRRALRRQATSSENQDVVIWNPRNMIVLPDESL